MYEHMSASVCIMEQEEEDKTNGIIVEVDDPNVYKWRHGIDPELRDISSAADFPYRNIKKKFTELTGEKKPWKIKIKNK